jgi:hypothetical protein
VLAATSALPTYLRRERISSERRRVSFFSSGGGHSALRSFGGTSNVIAVDVYPSTTRFRAASARLDAGDQLELFSNLGTAGSAGDYSIK